jgi:hypothetical protein
MKGMRKNKDDFINPKTWYFVWIRGDTTYILRSQGGMETKSRNKYYIWPFDSF